MLHEVDQSRSLPGPELFSTGMFLSPLQARYGLILPAGRAVTVLVLTSWTSRPKREMPRTVVGWSKRPHPIRVAQVLRSPTIGRDIPR